MSKYRNPRSGNTTIGSALGRDAVRDLRTRIHEINPNLLKGDGVDHINICVYGETRLGKLLSHSTKMDFKHPVYGQFASIESFWHWVQNEQHPDTLRYLHGTGLRDRIIKLNASKRPRRVWNFEAIILQADYYKIRANTDLWRLMRESTLPFTHYTISRDTGLKTQSSFAQWLCRGLEEIRTAIKAGDEPAFSSFYNASRGGIDDEIRRELGLKTDAEIQAERPYVEPPAALTEAFDDDPIIQEIVAELQTAVSSEPLGDADLFPKAPEDEIVKAPQPIILGLNLALDPI